MADNPSSTANIGDHPIHPMLVGFPIAFLVATLASDLAFVATGSAFWSAASVWLLRAAVVMGALAAVAGLIDFLGEPRIRALTDAWHHFIGNAIAITLAIVNLALRYFQGADGAIKPWGLILSLVVVGILLYTGWKGWEMVYKHRVSVISAPEQKAAPTHRRAA